MATQIARGFYGHDKYLDLIADFINENGGQGLTRQGQIQLILAWHDGLYKNSEWAIGNYIDYLAMMKRI